MNRRIALITFGLVMLFVVSCGPQLPKAGQFNFKQGIAEPQLRLLDGAPPEKIYPNSNFKVVVNLDNQAAYPIVDGKITLVGIVGQYFAFDQLEKNFNLLEGRSVLAPDGEKAFIEFDGKSRQPFVDTKEYTNNYLIIASYNSKVDFIDSICVNSNLYAVYDAGCTVENKKSYSGQGAPLSVTDLEEIITPGQGIELRLTLRNRGRGKVTFVNLENARLGTEPLNCRFSDANENQKSIQFTADKQEATIICAQPLRNQHSYTTSVAVNFNYGYEHTESYRLILVK